MVWYGEKTCQTDSPVDCTSCTSSGKKTHNNAQSYEKSYPRKYCQNHYLVLDQVILFAIDSLSKYKIHIFYFFLSQKIFKLSAQQILCFID